MNKLASFASKGSWTLDAVGLAISVVIVHTIYFIYIDPSATETVYQATLIGEPPPRTFAVVLKDFEQEVCLVLGLWCLWLWLFRYKLFLDEAGLLNEISNELGNKEELSEQTLDELRESVVGKTASDAQGQLLGSVKATLDALTTISSSEQFKRASDIGTESCELYLEQLDSKLNLTKYILWAIPSVGFLGTVRGIGQALTKAGEAMAGDISGVAASLGVAFNSTFCAIFISLVLMFFSYLLQGREERLVATYKRFISTELVGRLSGLPKATVITS